NKELTHQLLLYGFKQSAHDHCLFLLRTSTFSLVLLVYVDDVLVTSDSLLEATKIKQFLHSQFSIKDLGTASYYLGLELLRSSVGL
ncbi:reverse transcriptase domain-containing protein, partial [Shigella flexneri]|nr:reverse transcriptase domain-containing protein [Shigella flexneri]